jgi:hypothetical protein
MTHTALIIQKIRQNRICTTEVADCMNKTGLLDARLHIVNQINVSTKDLSLGAFFVRKKANR